MLRRFFIELAYKGTAYSGFQVQENARTIQSELETALATLLRTPVALTGSSRTDAGVHALQNFFHADIELKEERIPKLLYQLNAILPVDIVVKDIRAVGAESHSRFDAKSREYRYFIYKEKDPFLKDRAYYFPYTIDRSLLDKAAAILMEYHDFTSFSKRKTQVKTFNCTLFESKWTEENGCLVYYVKGNRFLRGMVRALVATMLKVGRGKITLEQFRAIIEAKDCTKADFSVPACGLFLVRVNW